MNQSNSSLNCFQSCPKMYELEYIREVQPDYENLDFKFGSMAHKILYDEGMDRDAYTGKDWKPNPEYIPKELEYPELKNKYKINSWDKYFNRICMQTYEYEQQLMNRLIADGESNIEILREERIMMTSGDLRVLGWMVNESVVGVLDLLILAENHAAILDYKFTNTRKTQADFDENSQLQLYAFMVCQKYHIPMNNIIIGYIDIPKVDFDMPDTLKDGTLSRNKLQNVDVETYKECIIAIHGENDPVYNWKPGGHYHDIVEELSLKKPAYMQTRMIDPPAYKAIIEDLFATIKIIEVYQDCNLPFVRKYSSYSCANCMYRKTCKPWLTVGGDE